MQWRNKQRDTLEHIKISSSFHIILCISAAYFLTIYPYPIGLDTIGVEVMGVFPPSITVVISEKAATNYENLLSVLNDVSSTEMNLE